MALDPNIPLQVRPVQMPDFNALGQQRLAGTTNILALQKNAQETQEKNALRRVYSSAVNPQTGEIDDNKLVTGLAGAGRGDLIPQVQATLADTAQKRAGADKATLELHLEKTNNAIGDIARVSNPVQAVGLVKKYVAAGDLDPAKGQDYIAQITANPKNWQALQQSIMTDALSVKDQLAQRLEQQKFGYQQQNDAANRSVTMRGQDITARGQNLTHQAAMARLNAETASGDPLSKDALDLVANVYLQTGTMPPLGMGKAAAATRAQVLSRAAQLAGGGGAAAAQTVIGNKQNVAAQTGALKDFTSGMSSRKVTSFNAVSDHLESLGEMGKALNNGNARAFNAIAQTLAKQTGSAVPTNFDQARNIVGQEVVKAIVANGGGEAERQAAANAFSTHASPAQIQGAIDTAHKLMGGQLHALQKQYEAGTGRKDFDSRLTPAAKRAMGAHSGPTVSNW